MGESEQVEDGYRTMSERHVCDICGAVGRCIHGDRLLHALSNVRTIAGQVDLSRQLLSEWTWRTRRGRTSRFPDRFESPDPDHRCEGDEPCSPESLARQTDQPCE